jgi:MFS family permease
MAHDPRRLIATIIAAVGIASVASATSATPVTDALVIKNAVPASVENVQWRRGWRGGGWGWGGAAAGFIAGAVVGSALTAPYYYGYGPYYPGPYYYGPPAPPDYGPPAGPAYGAPVAGDAAAYCAQRFKSYDPATGTYLGYDGVRHPCP